MKLVRYTGTMSGKLLVNKLRFGTVAIVIALFASSCATTYQPMSYTGGYRDSALGNGLYQVEFSGNGFTNRSVVNDYFLRRCAEVTLDSGNDYFLLVDQASYANQSNMQTNTYGTVSRDYWGNYNYSGRTQTTTVTKHSKDGVIKVFKDGEQPPFAFGAREILSRYSTTPIAAPLAATSQ